MIKLNIGEREKLLDLFASELLAACTIMTKKKFTASEVTSEPLEFLGPSKVFVYPILGIDEVEVKSISGFVGLYFNHEVYSKLIPLIFNVDKSFVGFGQIGGELLNMAIGRARDALSNNNISLKKNFPFSVEFEQAKIDQISYKRPIQKIIVTHDKFQFAIFQYLSEVIL